MIVGRYQPFHKGHEFIIDHTLTEVDDLIIVIAASMQSHQPDNPFTAGERYEMIYNSLRETQDMSLIKIIPANDVHDNSLWPHHIIRLVPHFDRVYSNNPLTRFLFASVGKDVQITPIFQREKYSARHIRELLAKEDIKWRKLVPKETAKVIDRIHGMERMKHITATDEYQKKFK
jgi:nicotinamide-nucleotide adenylyltransferase